MKKFLTWLTSAIAAAITQGVEQGVRAAFAMDLVLPKLTDDSSVSLGEVFGKAAVPHNRIPADAIVTGSPETNGSAKRGRGRPKKPAGETPTAKRGRGRPKKNADSAVA